jgi:hypothetical protein
MLDMSKAFDTVDRNKLLNLLAEILDEGEMRLMDILISDVLLNVRLGYLMGHANEYRDCTRWLFICHFIHTIFSPIIEGFIN